MFQGKIEQGGKLQLHASFIYIGQFVNRPMLFDIFLFYAVGRGLAPAATLFMSLNDYHYHCRDRLPRLSFRGLKIHLYRNGQSRTPVPTVYEAVLYPAVAVGTYRLFLNVRI